MASTPLTADGWKNAAAKFKLKDKDLQQALAVYEDSLGDHDWDLRLKNLARISALANTLKRAKEVAPQREAVKYLSDLAAAAESEKVNVTKQKAAAAKLEAMSRKKAEADAKNGEESEEEEEQGEYEAVLLRAFQKLKSAKDMVYEFLICDAKPLGLALAKKITAQHRAMLAKVTGSKRFLPVGTCGFQDGKFNFTLEKPVTGMARRLQESIKAHTGKKLPIRVGLESADAEEEAPSGNGELAAPGHEGAAARPVADKAAAAKQAAQERKALAERRDRFKKARAAWVSVKAKAEADLEKVKNGARMQYLSDPQQYPKVQKGCEDIDAILDHLDDELRDTLDQYASTPLTNQPKLHALAQSASEILDRYLHYVANDPIIKAIDKKEFADVVVHAPVMRALTGLRAALA